MALNHSCTCFDGFSPVALRSENSFLWLWSGLKRNLLQNWYPSSFKDIADTKKLYMHVDDSEQILMEFSEAFNPIKPLYRKIRGILFPLQETGALFIGTRPDPPEKLCEPILQAFVDAIEDSQK